MERVRCRRVDRTRASNHATPLARAPQSSVPLGGRAAAQGRRLADAPAPRLRALPPDPADRRARLHLRGDLDASASCAGRCAARARRSELVRRRARPRRAVAPRAAELPARHSFAPPWTPSPSRHHRQAARGGLRVPRGHRQPRRVHRPLPRGLAADARGPVRRGAGARFRVDAPLNRFAWADMTFAEVEAPRRIVEVGRSGKYNRIRTRAIWTLEPAAGGGTRVEFTLETEPAAPTDRFLEALGAPRGWFKRKNAQGAAAAAGDPRGGPRPGARATVAGLVEFRRPMRRLVRTRRRSRRCSLAGAACGNKEEYHRRRDRGRLPRPRRAEVPGADLAPAQPPTRGPELLVGCRGTEPPAPTSGSASSSASRTRPTSRPGGRRRSRSTTPRGTSTSRSRSTRTSTCSRTAARRRAAERDPRRARLSAAGQTRSRARCCCSGSRSTSLQNRPLELRSRTGEGASRPARSTSTSSRLGALHAPPR